MTLSSPKLIVERPPGGAWTRVICFSVKELPAFWFTPEAYALDDSKLAVGDTTAGSAPASTSIHSCLRRFHTIFLPCGVAGAPVEPRERVVLLTWERLMITEDVSVVSCRLLLRCRLRQ